MKAQRIHQWGGPLALEEVPSPVPREGEVLIQVEACGIGLTVLNCIRGDLGHDPAALPRVPGHELVGRIVGVGPGVPDERVGERVCAYFYLFCGRCRRCLAGLESLCANLVGYVGVDRDGGYAEMTVLPARNAICLPEPLDPVLATAIPDAIATPVHVAHRAAIQPGERVVVIAAGGGVGIHMVQVARLHGADVVGLDRAEDKLAYLRQQFQVETVNSTDFAGIQLPARWTGKADVIIDLLGRPASLAWAVTALGTGGRLVLLTTFPGIGFQATPREMVFRQATILGSRYASRWELDRAARLVASGHIRPVVSRRVGLDELGAIHESLQQGTLLGRGAVVLTG
jgi:D-arabinose 1-dehydrogenase-like Zn-dependent alcohol dehydrogenase